MNKIWLIVVLLVIIQCYLAKAQGFSDYVLWHPLSPQTSDFMKYGNTTVSYFNGETNVKIPIYTYTDKDFDLPVFLGYNSSGFNPNKNEGIVGLNWYLNAGGMITRTVKGFPDDKTGEPSSNPKKLHGLYYGIKNFPTVKTASRSNIFSFLTGTVSTDLWWSIDGCEVEPDEFNFNAPGCSGQFFIENNGSVRCVGNKNYTVNLNNFAIQPTNGSTISNSEIIVTTDNGYKYYFGGSIQNLEVSFPLGNASSIDMQNSEPVIVAWHITKIVSPNGRVLKYYYKTFKEGFGVKNAKDQYHYFLQVHDNDFGTYSSMCNNYGGGQMCSYTSSSGFESSEFELTKSVYLEKIAIGQDTIMKFAYIPRTNKFYADFTSGEIAGLNLNLMQLKYIYVKQNNSVLNTFTLSYTYTGGVDGNRYFLSSFLETGMGPYTLTYYKQSLLPNPRTHGIDYWGFWNGGSYGNNLIPSINYSQNGDLVYTSAEREPNESKCDVGMLEQINYPTGGNTHFSYEGHRYSKRLERRIANNFLPALYPETGLAGGSRIHEITDNDGAGNIMTKTYSYYTNYPSTATSSGILLDWPRYMISWKYDGGGTQQVDVRKQSNSLNFNHSNNEKYIQYSEVTEKISPDNGCTVYKFTNYETNRDTNDYGSKVLNPSSQVYITNKDLYNNYIGIKMNDCSFQRGYPYMVSTYSGSGTILHRKEVTLFTTLSDYPDNYLVSVLLTGGIAQSHKIYYVPFLPKTEVETSYLNGSIVGSATNYIYNGNNLLTEMSQTKSQGGVTTNKTKYITDCKNYAPYNAMFNLNILAYPVEKTTLQDGNVTGSKLTTYKLEDGNYKPNQVFSLETMTPFAGFNYYNGTTKDTHYSSTEEINYQDYDTEGNILKFIKKDGLTTYLIWGYNNQYPVVRIESTNNSYDLTTIRSTIANHSFSIDNQEETSYLKAQLSSYIGYFDCMVTLYTYKPLVGMTSQTDPNGKTTYYKYDDFGRLQLIRDDQNNILKKIDYHYSTQN